MNIQTVLDNYRGLDDATSTTESTSEEYFKSLKEIAISQGVNFERHLFTAEYKYMEDHHNFVFPNECRTKSGDYKYRTYSVPDTLEDRNLADINNLKYTPKVKHLKTGVKCTLEINGLPSGYYTAKRAIIAGIEAGVPNWEEKSKTKIEAETRSINRVTKTPQEKIDKAYSIIIKELNNLDNETSKRVAEKLVTKFNSFTINS